MKLLILGGGALGEQACRLAKAAGIYTIVADSDKDCPAAALADELIPSDEPLPPADFVLPATEDETLLRDLAGDNVLFDKAAWVLASSRLASDKFLRERGIPLPEYFPGGSEPYIVKPDRGSFGRGIWVTEDFCEVGGAVNAGFVTQEELTGDVWSVCVLGKPGAYTAYAPAKLTFDGRRRRTAAECCPHPAEEALKSTTLQIAEAMALRGILEVEAIFHQNVWKVTDLNARIPMLTPDAVLEATGVNLLEELCKQ